MILLTFSVIYSLLAATADFSVAFMHTPMTEEVFVEPREEANLLKDKSLAIAKSTQWKALSGGSLPSISGGPT